MSHKTQPKRKMASAMKKFRIRLAFAFTSMSMGQIAKLHGVNRSTVSRCIAMARVPRAPRALDKLERIEEYWVIETKGWGLDRTDFMLLTFAYLAWLRSTGIMTHEQDEDANKVFVATNLLARRGPAALERTASKVAGIYSADTRRIPPRHGEESSPAARH